MTHTLVVDTSDFDADYDAANLRRAGVSGGTNKATEGTRFQHTSYRRRLEAFRANMPVYGAYVVPRTPGNGGNGTVNQQVDYYLSYITRETPWWQGDDAFFHQLDLEVWTNSAGQIYDSVSAATGLAFYRRLAQLDDHVVTLYASYGQYGNQLWGQGVQLWNAAYHTNAQQGPDAAYAAGGGDRSWDWHLGEYALWQFGSRVSLGDPAHVGDCSAALGTEDDLISLLHRTRVDPASGSRSPWWTLVEDW